MQKKRRPMTRYERMTQLSETPSQYIKYDKTEGLWIQHRKVAYLYWFKFLQHAERDDRFDVDWEKYESWGGKDVVMNTKFDDWWKEYWKRNFGFTKGNPTDAPFHTKKNPEIPWLRTCCLIYERFLGSHRRNKWEIGCWVRKYERSKGRTEHKSLRNAIPELFEKNLTKDELSDMSVGQTNRMKRQQNIVDREESVGMYAKAGKRVIGRSNVEEISTTDYDLKQEKKRVQQYVGRFQKSADQLMLNISKGSLDPP